MAEEFEMGPEGLLVPKSAKTTAETRIKKKGKDFIEKAIADPDAMHIALLKAAEKLVEPKVDLDADLVDKTSKLLETLPEPKPEEVMPTLGRSEVMFLDEMFSLPDSQQAEAQAAIQAGKVKSDGGSTSYYELPAGATELNDLIEHKGMSFALGNIFKACYRLGEKDGNDLLYDINKIIFFAERMKKHVQKKGRLP